MVIWFTGLSGSGKTTLCRALVEMLKPKRQNVVVLDGDVIREVFGNDLSHRLEDRHIQIGRLQRMAKLLSSQGLVVLVAAVYSNPDILKWNRDNLFPYLEIYMEASIDTLKRRDPKGLYAKAAAGELSDVVGIDIPWVPPEAPDVIINTDAPEKAEVSARRIIVASEPLIERMTLNA